MLNSYCVAVLGPYNRDMGVSRVKLSSSELLGAKTHRHVRTRVHTHAHMHAPAAALARLLSQ